MTTVSTGLAPRHRRCEAGGRARRRSLRVRCTQLVPQASLPVAGGTCTHGMLAHHTVLTCVLASCSCRLWKGSGAHIHWISMTGQVLASCYLSWCVWLCIGLRQDAARDARERVALGALYTRRTVPCEHVLFGAMSKRVVCAHRSSWVARMASLFTIACVATVRRSAA